MNENCSLKIWFINTFEGQDYELDFYLCTHMAQKRNREICLVHYLNSLSFGLNRCTDSLWREIIAIAIESNSVEQDIHRLHFEEGRRGVVEDISHCLGNKRQHWCPISFDCHYRSKNNQMRNRHDLIARQASRQIRAENKLILHRVRNCILNVIVLNVFSQFPLSDQQNVFKSMYRDYQISS